MYSKYCSILIVMIIIISALHIEFEASANIPSLGTRPLNRTITVDDSGGADYTRINDALTQANSGDTILVKPGTYNEMVTISKSITLKGTNPENTKIEGFNWSSVIQIKSDWVNVSGFSIIGSGTKYFNAGILIGNHQNCNVSNNNCSGNYIGILIYGSNNIIADNICNSNSEDGILIYGTSSNRPTQNRISNNKCNYNKENGINSTTYTNTGSNNYFINNTCFSNSNHGIYSNMLFNTISNNSCFKNNVSGIYIITSKNIFKNNYLYKNKFGIKLESNERNDIINNTCFSNKLHGLILKNSILNYIKNNNFSNNDNGIFLNFESNSNNIYENIISSNSIFGIKIDEYPRLNKIYHNNFISNNVQGADSSVDFNYWYHTSYEVGNYWSDYKGFDNGEGGRVKGDGIGDSSIPHLGLDKYPFIERNGWLYPGIPILKDPGTLDSDGNYNVTWSLAHRATGYILEEDFDESFNSSLVIYQGSNLSFRISNKSNGRYFYRVRSVKGQFKSKWSNIVNITVSRLPGVPQNFTASINPEGNEIILSWSPNPKNTQGYYIEFKTNSTKWEHVIIVSHPSSSYTHTKLTDGLTYYYRIRAKNEFSQFSKYSDKISATPRDLTAPKRPTELKIIKITNKSITLEWEPNLENDLKGYNIYRKSNPNITYNDLPINGDNIISQTIYFDENLNESTTYFYRITALDEVPHESGFSDIISGTTLKTFNKPLIDHPQQNFQIQEDTMDSTTINLFDWFRDPDGDSLTFNCSGQEQIEIVIFQESGKVVIKPEENWNGQEVLIFSASDGIYEISDDVVITVTPVNDAPENAEIVRPENGLVTNDSTIVYFSGKCDDLDLNYGDELEYMWVLNDMQIISREIEFSETLSAGVYKVTFMIFDSSDASTNTSVTITVEKSGGSEPPEIPPGTPEDENKTESKIEDHSILFLVTGFSIIFIILIFVILNFQLLKRRISSKHANNNIKKQNKRQEPGLKKKKLEKGRIKRMKKNNGKYR